MKRIICTVTNDLSHDQRMIRICSTLVEAGYEVWLVGRQKPNSPPLPDRPFKQIRLPCRYQKGKRFYGEFNLRLLRFLIWNKCDIINAVDLDTLLPGFLISRWRKIPCVYDAHEYFTETPEVVRRPQVQRVWEKLADGIIPNLRHCYTVAPQLAKVFTQRYGVPFSVVRNVPQRITSPPSHTPKEKIILYQGMLNEARGLETAIDAMAHLPECKLWLVGDGDIRQALEDRAAELGLSDRVLFHGFVPPNQLPDWTAKAWLGLNLLENKGLSYYYSLANKALDYIQIGLPSIQMDFPEYRALQDEYNVFQLLDELNPEKLAAGIRRLLEQKEVYQQIQQNCRVAAEELCWEKEKERLYSSYNLES